MAVTFFIPYGLLISELGSTFPEEGGPYIWTRMAFGRFLGALHADLSGSRIRSGWAASSP